MEGADGEAIGKAGLGDIAQVGADHVDGVAGGGGAWVLGHNIIAVLMRFALRVGAIYFKQWPWGRFSLRQTPDPSLGYIKN